MNLLLRPYRPTPGRGGATFTPQWVTPQPVPQDSDDDEIVPVIVAIHERKRP